MRRWLALFLLVLLPLLSTWSVASAYCGDESAAAAKHFGHHVDAHHEGDQAQPADTAAAGDCDHCHSPGATLTCQVGGAQAAAHQVPARWAEVALRAPPTALPERPNWARLA